MKKLILPLITISAVVFFGTSAVWAQSSGNFAATANNTVCTQGAFGILTGAPDCSVGNPFCASNTGGGTMKAQIKLPNSSPGLLVTPSLDTGMYTSTIANNSASFATAAIVVNVTDTIGTSTTTLTPNQTCVDTSTAGMTTCTGPGTSTSGPAPECKCGVSYDQRFQELANANSNDTIKLVLSTLSAHSFNFTEGNVPGGIHTLTMNWYFGCNTDSSGNLHTAQCMGLTVTACAGPGTLTVQQVQNYQHDSPIQSTGP